MAERVMTQGTYEYLFRRKGEVESLIREKGSESSGHQRASLHDDAGAENQLNLLRAELRRIGDLSTVEIIKPREEIDQVNLGNKVRVEFEDGEEEVTILGRDDVVNRNDLGTIVSPDSPLGKAIIGKTKGNLVEFRIGQEQKTKVKILGIFPGNF